MFPTPSSAPAPPRGRGEGRRAAEARAGARIFKMPQPPGGGRKIAKLTPRSGGGGRKNDPGDRIFTVENYPASSVGSERRPALNCGPTMGWSITAATVYHEIG